MITSIFNVVLLLLVSPVMNQELDPDWLYNGASTLMRHFHSRFGHQMCQHAIHTKSNVVYSSFRVFESLAAIYSAASDSVKDDLNLHLGIYGRRRELMCHTIDQMRKLTPCLQNNNFGAKFGHMMFYQSGFFPNETIVNNQCFERRVKPINFTDTERSLQEIKEWRELISPTHYTQDLGIPLNINYELIFTNGIVFCMNRMTPYISDGYINMMDINGNTRQVKAMKKHGKMYVLKDVKSNVTLIREDLPGGAYYSVVVTQDNFEPSDHIKFMQMFGGGILSELLLKVSKITTAKLMEVRLPEIQMETRIDLKEILSGIASASIFKYGAFPDLLDVETKLDHFSYFEALNITGKLLTWQETLDSVLKTAVTTPFMYIILDKQYSRPLITATHLGFS